MANKKRKPRRKKPLGLGTLTVHSGEERVKYADALTVPIVQTSTYVFHSTEEIKRYTTHKVRDKEAIRYEYARYGNPTQEAVEKKLAILEGADLCLLFATGMSRPSSSAPNTCPDTASSSPSPRWETTSSSRGP